MNVLSMIRKTIAAILGNGAVVAEIELIPDGEGRLIVSILTLVAAVIAVYAVPNAGTAVRPAAPVVKSGP